MIEIIIGKRGCGKSTLLKNILDTKENKVIIYDFIGEHEGLICSSIEEVHKNMNCPIISFRNAREDMFNLLCEYVYERGNVTFAIEEVDCFTSANYCPAFLSYIIRYGRHKNINLIGITRRPADIPRLLTSQANKLYLFKISEPRDIEYLQKYSRDSLNDMGRLKEYQYQEITL